MAEPKQSALQRIQVGIFGIVMVLVIVSITNVMRTKTEVEEAVATTSEEPEPQLVVEEQVPDEPLAELGVAPATEQDPELVEETPLEEADLDGPNTAPVE